MQIQWSREAINPGPMLEVKLANAILTQNHAQGQNVEL